MLCAYGIVLISGVDRVRLVFLYINFVDIVVATGMEAVGSLV